MKTFAKFLLLAQTASDAGKGYISSSATNVANAIEKNYSAKDMYIRQAISHLPHFCSATVSYDNNMTVVMFDIPGFGQVSFHTWQNYDHLFIGGWNGIRGGSIMTCQKLAKKFNLPFYNHGNKSRKGGTM